MTLQDAEVEQLGTCSLPKKLHIYGGDLGPR